ncbi:MAG: Trk system potassium transporter TrkA [Planctomycetota bacterium]
MKVITVGAGEVGFHIADRLAREGHDVTIIEMDPEKEGELRSKLNALVIRGSGASVDALKEAQIDKADLFIAVTDQDEVNLVSCLLAHEYRVPKMVARIKSIDYAQSEWKSNAARLGIDLLINPDTVVANEICDVVAYPAATEVAEFAGGKVVFLGYPIAEGSPLAGISLIELGGVRGIYRLVVTALKRGDQTLIPRGEDTIEQGDILYFVCNRRELPAINYLFGFEKRKTKSIFLLGAGHVGTAVARRLSRLKYRVKVIDHNREHCEDLARDLDDVLVLNTDGTDVDTLRSEGIEDADLFIAVTQDERSNILCSLLAKRNGAKRAIALVNQPTFVGLAPSLGVDACVSPRLASASAILRFVRRAEVLRMAVVEQCDAEVLEMGIKAGGSILDRPLKDLQVPRGAIVGAITRGEEVIIPGGDDVLKADDHVIVFALPDAVKEVEEFFS